MTTHTISNSIVGWALALIRLVKGFGDAILHPRIAFNLYRDVRIIKNSGLFDIEYYLTNYHDNQFRINNPIQHYCEVGWKENYNPSAQFNTHDYLLGNPDIAAAGINPLAHFIKYGKSEGRYVLASLPAEAIQVTESKPTLSVFSRAALAILIFPATLFHYANLRDWFKAIGSGETFFMAVLESPDQCQERLSKAPKPLRAVLSALLSIAMRIQKNNGVLPTVRNVWLILLKQGPKGVLQQLKTRVSYNRIVARELPSQSRILVMDYRVPRAETSAGDRATVGILGNLCEFGYEVVFLPSDMVDAPVHADCLRQLGIHVVTPSEGYESSAHYLSQQGHTFAVFYLIRLDVAESVLGLIRQVAPQSKVIFHAPDLSFLREAREYELKDKLSERAENPEQFGPSKLLKLVRSFISLPVEPDTRTRELAVISQVDHTVIVSPAELPVLRQFLPECPVSVFPVLYAPVVEEPAPFSARRDIFFLGGFAHKPNIDAACWFAKEIWPMIHAQIPAAIFHIVGSEAPTEILDLGTQPGIVVDGFVEDLEPLLSSMRLGVAPLRFGSGIKGKVAMTMGAGIPCVCTSIAAEGMGMVDGIHTRVADDPVVFAEAVINLYTNASRWESLASHGKQLVLDQFGQQANKASLLTVLNEADILPVDIFIEYCHQFSQLPFTCPPEGENVDVSIVIPVSDRWEHTQNCLDSILTTCLSSGISFETLLADDGSTDKTQEAAKYYAGLRILRSQTKLGLSHTCNQAVNDARGRYIIILDNDTVVLPGWLLGLYAAIEADETAAIIGSKLLNPDRTILAAGSLIWDGGAVTYCGKSSARNNSDYAYIREVEYLPEMCLLIRKSFWIESGGLDTAYQDTQGIYFDLMLSARSNGMRVIYQPKSELIAVDNTQLGNGNRPGPLPLPTESTQRLKAKWASALSECTCPRDMPEHLAIANAQRQAPLATRIRRGQGNLNVLYFSPFPSHPSSHGNQSTIQQFGRRFQAMGHKVHFALLNSQIYSESDLRDMRDCWDTLDILPNSVLLRSNGKEIPFDSWYQQGLGENIRKLCLKYDIDIVFCSYVFQSKLLEFVPAYMLKVIDTHDKMGNRYEMLRANKQPVEFFSCTPEEEGAYLRRADLVVARREEEARYFDSVTGLSTAIVIPHVEEPRFSDKTFADLANVGTVASANRINLVIVQEFLQAIARRLQGAQCPFTVHVAGQIKNMVDALPPADAKVFNEPWVEMKGFVPDIATFYEEMDVIISPVTMGTGINVKTVQAMAFGMPLLTTAWGAKGIETGDPLHSHADMNALVDSLFALKENSGQLQRLAELSRTRYSEFFEESLASMRGMFEHPKLRKPC